MREFGSKRTHGSNGDELSELFISGDDGTLTTYIQDNEVEIVGCLSTVHADGFVAVVK